MSSCTDLDDYWWLIGPEAAPWLGIAAEVGEATVQLTAKLRRELSAERVRLVLEQARLRRRAKEKFPAAERMFFTAIGLEQATDAWVAAYKAERLAARLAACAAVADLCCGIGGDLAAITQQMPATGVDRDPIAGLFAEANAGGHATRPPVNVRVGNVEVFSVGEYGAWHIDPDRRPTGRRTTRAVLHEPSLDVLERLLQECPNAAVKLAPAAELPDGWANRAELEWISSRRECRQLVAWFGGLTDRPGQRQATVLGRSHSPRTILETADAEIVVATQIGKYVFEPDPAVLAAGLSGALAAEHDVASIALGIAYFTGDHPVDDSALSCFEVLEVLPLRVATLKSWLDARGIGRLEIKKRSVKIEPEVLRARLKLRGENEATLLIAPVERKPLVIAARRIS